MKAVLISIQPQWCEKIAVRDKLLEVRKTRPNIQTPFKCYIYQTKRKWWYKTLEKLATFAWARARARTVMEGQGKVIGEFFCDQIIESRGAYGDELFFAGLTYEELQEYGQGRKLYGWHISDLVIYDKPRPLSDFTPICKFRNENMTCPSKRVACSFQEPDYNQDGSFNLVECTRRLTRPPQSWCYVEEV